MEWSAWLLGAATISVGAVLTLVAGLVQERFRRQWARVDAEEAAQRNIGLERRRRIEERSEVAADEILVLLDQAYDLLSECRTHGSDPPQHIMAEKTQPMRRKAVLLGAQTVRERVEGVATMLEQTHAVGNMTGDVPSQVAWRARAIGRNALGHLLSEEPLNAGETLREYLQVIEDYHAMLEESQRSNREDGEAS